MSGQQLIHPVNPVIVDAAENVGEIGLRVEAVELGGFDDGHGEGQGFGTCVCPCK